jgi:D-alanyl-D-alanine carboxypeptidase
VLVGTGRPPAPARDPSGVAVGQARCPVVASCRRGRRSIGPGSGGAARPILPRPPMFDPLLPDERSPSEEPSSDRRSGSPGARRSAVVLGLCALVVGGVLVLTEATDEGEGEGAGTATTSAVATASSTTAPSATVPATVAPAATAPSIDAPGSLWWLVNRDRPLPPGYVPPDLVVPDVPGAPGAEPVRLTVATADAFERLAAAAAEAGFALQLTSGYRSEQDQRVLHDAFVEDFGRDVAAGLVAPPGTSEHQTGLAADVGLVGLPDDQVFGSTPASAWVTANAARFGFVLRYPPAKAHITGYANEPWHLRYVGVELAGVLHASGLTMEEHFGLAPAGG